MTGEADSSATATAPNAETIVNDGSSDADVSSTSENPPVEAPPAVAPAAPAEAPPVESTVAAPAIPAEPVAPAAPETYELALADDAVIDSSYVDVVKAKAKDRGYTQEQAAQSLADANEAAQAQRTIDDNAWTAEKGQMVVDLKANKEFSGENGELFDSNSVIVQEFVKEHGDAELADKLLKTGIGNYPPLVLAFLRAAKRGQEGSIVEGAGIKGENLSGGELIYDHPSS